MSESGPLCQFADPQQLGRFGDKSRHSERTSGTLVALSTKWQRDFNHIGVRSFIPTGAPVSTHPGILLTHLMEGILDGSDLAARGDVTGTLWPLP